MSAALSWTNHVRDDLDGVAALTATSFTSASIDSAYPAANLIDPDPSLVTRVNYVNTSGSTRNLILTSTFSAANDKTVRVVAALNCRIETGDVSGNITLRAKTITGTSSGGTYGYATTILDPIPGTTDRFNLFGILAADFSGAAFELDIPIATGNSGYIEVGHLWAGPALVYSNGVDRDWQLGAVDQSKVTRAPGGGFAAYRYPSRRVLDIGLGRGLLTYAEAIGTSGSPTVLSLRRMMLEAGIGSPVVAVTRDSSYHTLQALSLYGLVEQLPAVSHLGGDYYGASLRIAEIR